ncbi:MAG: methylated-DNA--[protein]-cysteine S-methyltransferase [Bacilli bacterium]|nr:methylated-DNA--[protein]-cysteine S-methyltransferase [Bacilli bacterium]
MTFATKIDELRIRNQKMKKHTYATKIGNITIFQEEDFIIGIQFSTESQDVGDSTPLMNKTKAQIDEYLDGLRKEFDIPYKLYRTSFQTQVLRTLSEVQYGEIISYKELAIRAGNPNAFRAVGSVCKSNPLPIIIPCHRVIKSNGEIGFYNGGVKTKKRLLDLENK